MKSENAKAMLNEIAEEVTLFEEILRDKERYTKGFVDLFRTHDFKRIYLSGCGSPGNVSMVVQLAITKLLKIEATYTYPMLFNNHMGFNVGGLFKPEEMLLICPGESGHTKGPVISAREAKRLGIPVVCTTYNTDGILARESDVVIEKISKEEIGAPSTKGHSTGMYLLLLCVVEAAHALATITEEEYARYMDGFKRLIKSVDDAREKTLKWFADHQDIAMHATNYKVVGYGVNSVTAVEAVLKFIESHRRPTAGFELEEFMHGPTRALFPEDVIFFIYSEDCPEKERMLELYNTLKKYVRNCILVQSTADAYQDPQGISFDAVNMDLLSAIEYVVPFQVLSYTISDALGMDMSLDFPVSISDSMHPYYTDED